MNYEKLLREHNLKVTPQRLGILLLMYQNRHITVEELFIGIKKQFSSISLATLYKNIHAMLNEKLISEIRVPNGKSKYEITKQPHIHLLCQQCNEFADLELNIENLMNEASTKSHYKLHESNIVLCGLCKNCQNN